MPRGKRPPRAAAALSKAINNMLLGKKNVGPALAASAVGSSSSQPSFVSGRPCPSLGIGVKNMQAFRRRNKDLKIKKLLPQSKVVNVKKNGVVVRKMTVRRRAHLPRRHNTVY